jgi:hypothetical protein
MGTMLAAGHTRHSRHSWSLRELEALADELSKGLNDRGLRTRKVQSYFSMSLSINATPSSPRAPLCSPVWRTAEDLNSCYCKNGPLRD